MATETYTGSCHCGAVAFSVELDTDTALKCNCSICTKIGAVWAFASKDKFTLKSGAAAQGDYQFARKTLHHHYCTKCGVESYAEGAMPDGTPTVGINLRCVEGVDVDKLSPRAWDGRSL